MRVHPDVQALDRAAHEVATMICSEQVPAAEIDRAIDTFRDRFEAVLGDHPEVFERTYARRFRRLRTRFQPVRGLFDRGGAGL